MIGTGELIVILGLVLVLFGGKKLPEFARNLGRGIHEFKKGCAGIEDEAEIVIKPKETLPVDKDVQK
jgi:sec-independent protein translocase protein TatA